VKWPKACLGEVAQVISGATPKSSVDEYWDGDIPWITPADLSKLTTKEVSATSRRLTVAGLASCSSRILPERSVLLSSRAPIGHVAINSVPMATNQGFKSFVPDEKSLSPDFLYWWLKTNTAYLQSLGRGATFKEVSKEIVESIEIPLPPLEEQRRIAAILDKATSIADAQVRALELRGAMRESLFEDAFCLRGRSAVTIGADLPSHEYGWEWKLLKDVARLATGHTPDRGNDHYWGGDIPWITLGDIRDLDGCHAYATKEMTTPEGIANSSAVLLPEGTVCFSRTASVGFSAIMGREMCTSQDFVNWVCGPDLLPEYLMHALISSRSRLRGLSTGSTHKTIYFSTVEQFKVLVPPIAIQELFCDKVRKLSSLLLAESAVGLRGLEDSLSASIFATHSSSKPQKLNSSRS